MSLLLYRATQPNQLIKKLSTGLSAQAKEKKDFDGVEYFGFFVAAADQVMRGGCYGFFYYGCTHVDLLYLDEDIRKQGFGSRMMKEAEKLALEKNCSFITVNTMDWEALDFYKKLGYEVEFERRGYDKNSILYFLRKNLPTKTTQAI